MPAELTLRFFFFFLSLFPFFLLSFLSFLFPCFLFCDSSQMVVTVVLALFLPLRTARAPFYSACHGRILLFQPLTTFVWSGCTFRPPLDRLCATPHHQTKRTILFISLSWHPFLLRCGCLLSPYLSWHAPNHLYLVWVYLPTTTGPSVCHSPLPNKEDYFICQSAQHPFLIRCGCLFSPYLSQHTSSGSSSTLPVWAMCYPNRTLPPKEPWQEPQNRFSPLPTIKPCPLTSDL